MSNSLFRTKKIESILAEGGDDPHGGGGLKRVLSLRDLTFFGIAAILGAGSFSSLGGAVFHGGPGVVVLFIITAIACAFTAFCYSEFASRIPVAGSAYTYAYASFGELFAWIIGWALIMEYSIGNIYVAYSWSDYFTSFLERCNIHMPQYLSTSYMEAKHAIDDGSTNKDVLAAWNGAPTVGGLRIIFDLPALVINLLITYLVYRGIKESRNFSNVMVVLKMAVVLLIILVGGYLVFANGLTPNWLPADDAGVKSFMPNGFSGVMAAVAGVFFAYIGFDAVSVLAEESKNPQKDLPRGMILSLVICTVVYILLTLVLTGAANYRKFDGVGDPLAFIFEPENLNIPWMQFLVSICAVVAMTSVLLVFQMGQPRIWMSMSRDGLMPPVFQKIHPKYKTPSFSTIITGLVVGVPILFTDKTFVLDFTSIATLFAFVLVCGGVLLLPRREKKPGGFNMPYINSKLIYPVLVIGSILLIGMLFKDYFKDLFQFHLNEKDKQDVVSSVSSKTKADFSENYILAVGELSRIEKKLNKNKQLIDGLKIIEENNKVVNTVIDSLGAKTISSSVNYKNLIANSEAGPADSIVLIAPKDINFTAQLQNVVHHSASADKKKEVFSIADSAAIIRVLSAKADDSALLKKFRSQLLLVNLIQTDSTTAGSDAIRSSLDSAFIKLSAGKVRQESADSLLTKKTQNISLIVFWISCILLSILAFIKNWSLIPLMGLTTCMYLLTGMTLSNWIWFGAWLGIGLIIYLLYGFKKSRLAQG
jgi:basic amino acid/polyamine antiporter, APA family